MYKAKLSFPKEVSNYVMVETLLVEYVLKRLSGPRLLIKHLMEEPDFSQLIGLNDPID